MLASSAGQETAVSQGHERRRWPRISRRNRISLTILSAPEAPVLEGRRYYCWTEDLSIGGVRFQVHSRVPLASLLKMDIKLEDSADGSFVHVGRVAWEQEFEDNGLVSRWLGVEITETLGGEEREHRWHQMISGVPLADAS